MSFSKKGKERKSLEYLIVELKFGNKAKEIMSKIECPAFPHSNYNIDCATIEFFEKFLPKYGRIKKFLKGKRFSSTYSANELIAILFTVLKEKNLIKSKEDAEKLLPELLKLRVINCYNRKFEFNKSPIFEEEFKYIASGNIKIRGNERVG